eukprot:COSAG01_NODE_10027_length_2271_cov_5.982044_2_plen_169_part_00
MSRPTNTIAVLNDTYGTCPQQTQLQLDARKYETHSSENARPNCHWCRRIHYVALGLPQLFLVLPLFRGELLWDHERQQRPIRLDAAAQLVCPPVWARECVQQEPHRPLFSVAASRVNVLRHHVHRLPLAPRGANLAPFPCENADTCRRAMNDALMMRRARRLPATAPQ